MWLLPQTFLFNVVIDCLILSPPIKPAVLPLEESVESARFSTTSSLIASRSDEATAMIL